MLGTIGKCYRILPYAFGEPVLPSHCSFHSAKYPFQYLVEVNFGPNLFSLYDPSSVYPIFQIDANLGYPAAVLVREVISMFFMAPLTIVTMDHQQNALLQAPDIPTLSTPLVVTLLPALPPQWSSGSIKGARIRGGISVNFQWNGGIPTEAVFYADANAQARNVTVVYANDVLAEFVTTGGLMKSLSFA